MTRCLISVQSCAVVCLLMVAACSPLPDTGAEASASPRAATQAEAKLVPVDDILADADAFAQGGVAVGPLEARLAALRARAAQLRRQ